jgi:hypothetical protein
VGRRNDYAVQRSDGRYVRMNAHITYETLFQHLQGTETIGTYLINEYGHCNFAVHDSDVPDGLVLLAGLQSVLSVKGIPSYLEQSRRGGHLWVFLAESVPPSLLRAWLLPFCPPGVEFYPKQDRLDPSTPYGSLIRLPLGVHRRSGERYPFVELVNGNVRPVFASLVDGLSWFSTVQRVLLPIELPPEEEPSPITHHTLQQPSGEAIASTQITIRDWCLAHDPVTTIGRYVSLDRHGMGCCPFGSHHRDGMDVHPSFWVYQPTSPDLMCWWCHTWGQGGSLFDFFRLYYQLEARDLWVRILQGSVL